jgi:hypothetical protein
VRRGAITSVRGYTQQDAAMPWRGYIIWVSGALLLLLFAIDGLMPRTTLGEQPRVEVELPPIRIRSEAKGPEAVVIDTDHATMQAAPDQQLAILEPAALPTSGSEAQFGQAVAHAADQQAVKAGVPAVAPARSDLVAFAQVGQPGRSELSKPRTARSASPPRGKGLIEEARQHGERFGYLACEWCRPPNPGRAF